MALDDKQEKDPRAIRGAGKTSQGPGARAGQGQEGNQWRGTRGAEEEEEGAEKDAKAADKARQRVHDIRGASEDSVHALMEIAQRIEKRLDKRQESIWEWFFGPDEEEEKA